jgi:hypothetical protein
VTNEQDGLVRVPGADALRRGGWVSQPVRVYRDQWGIPHVRAQSMHDVLVGQGYAHAMDRLWKMDASRKQMQGPPAQWMIAIANGGLPVRIGLCAVLVAMAIGVMVPDLLLTT